MAVLLGANYKSIRATHFEGLCHKRRVRTGSVGAECGYMIAGYPIAKLLRSVWEDQEDPDHPFDLYIEAFKNSDWRAVYVIAVGGDSVVLELTDGNILKITTKRLEEHMGLRPFDCPILARGLWFDVRWFIQPKAETPVTEEECNRFAKSLVKIGYSFRDYRLSNVGRYHGRVCLLDPWAVARIGSYG